jgi:hypothetical protein
MVTSLGGHLGPPRGDGRDLRRVIRGVRRRWRLKVALKGTAIAFGFGLVAFAISAYGMDHFRYTPTAIAAFRVFTWTAFVGLLVRFLALPLAVRLPDERVALYIEEHDPSLQAALLSAVEMGPERVARDRLDLSPHLAERLVAQAVRRCEEIDYGRLVEGRSLQRVSGLLSGVATAGMVAALLSPAFVRQAVPFLFAWGSGEAESPYSIEVEPGHAKLARGSDQTIVAHLRGFDSDRVELAVQAGEGGEWQRWPMTAEPDVPGHRFMLLDVAERTDYYVEASGVRSGLFRLDVVDVPYVERIDLEYRFPGYTGLTPQLVEDGGDVAALRGTEVRLLVRTTVPVTSGQLVVEDEEPQPLAVGADGVLSGSLEVARDTFYRIDLPSEDGGFAAGSPDYVIEVLSDQPPSIRFLKPGRDAQVTAIEEVFTEVEAEDDFGLSRLELVYSVNGAPEETVTLHRGRRALERLSAGHTFFLEEQELEPGDFISYYARATDNRAVPGPQETSTDIYFMQIRPFDRAYRQAAEGGMPGGGGGGQGTLSLQQRQIVAATFKLKRDRERLERGQFEEDVADLFELELDKLQNQYEAVQRGQRQQLDQEVDEACPDGLKGHDLEYRSSEPDYPGGRDRAWTAIRSPYTSTGTMQRPDEARNRAMTSLP